MSVAEKWTRPVAIDNGATVRSHPLATGLYAVSCVKRSSWERLAPGSQCGIWKPAFFSGAGSFSLFAKRTQEVRDLIPELVFAVGSGGRGGISMVHWPSRRAFRSGRPAPLSPRHRDIARLKDEVAAEKWRYLLQSRSSLDDLDQWAVVSVGRLPRTVAAWVKAGPCLSRKRPG